MVKNLYLLKKNHPDKNLWGYLNSVMIIDINEEKARKKISKIYDDDDWRDPKKTSCEIIDVEKHKPGSILVEDICNCASYY